MSCCDEKENHATAILWIHGQRYSHCGPFIRKPTPQRAKSVNPKGTLYVAIFSISR